MTFVFFRNLPPEQFAQATASGWTQGAAGPDRDGRAKAHHPSIMQLRKWRNRRRSRMVLSQLNDHILKDIGLTYAEAEREANKPFWQP